MRLSVEFVTVGFLRGMCRHIVVTDTRCPAGVLMKLRLKAERGTPIIEC